MERTKSEKEAYLEGYGVGVKEESEFRCKVFNDFEWKARSLFFGFVESTENLEESFCDCNPNDELMANHKEDCMMILFRKDVENLSNKYSELKKEYSNRNKEGRKLNERGTRK